MKQFWAFIKIEFFHIFRDRRTMLILLGMPVLQIILFGFAITAIINIVGVPRFGYMACAWGAFVCYASMMLASFFIGQRVYPIRYDLKSAFRYTLLTVVLYAVAMVVPIESLFLRLAFRTLLLGVFLVYLFRHDLPMNEVPGLRRFVSKF